MSSLKKKLTHTDNSLVVARGGGGVGERDAGGQKVHASSYNK